MIYGYGNPGRQDDALGVLLVEQLDSWATENGMKFMDFDSNYQLNIEDALAMSEYDTVIFADASIEEISDFAITRLEPSQKTEFSMHAMAPEFILHLCQSLYSKYPDTFLVHIKGYEFEFLGQQTQQAKENLNDALRLLKKVFSESEKPIEVLDRFISDQKVEIK